MLVTLNRDLSSVDSEGRTAVYWAVGMPLNYKNNCSRVMYMYLHIICCS